MRNLSIELPDLVFDEAAREAAASGVSVEAFIAGMVLDGLHGSNDRAPLPSEQIEKVRRAQAEIKSGESYTDEEVAAHFARESDEAWVARLGAGTLRGPSLPDEALRRESIYADDAP